MPLNFRAPKSDHRRYKITAAELDIDLVDVLKESLALFIRHGTKITKCRFLAILAVASAANAATLFCVRCRTVGLAFRCIILAHHP